MQRPFTILWILCLTACAAPMHHGRSSQAPQRGLRIVSYNIALGLMLETHNPGLLRLSRRDHSIRAALTRHPSLRDYDILGLQEVCSDRNDLTRIQGKRTQLHVYFGRADPARSGECRKGQAILSRFPIVEAGTIQLPQERRVGRSAIWTDIALPGPRLMRVYNVHQENRDDGTIRAAQTRAVLRHAMIWRQRNPTAPLVILGDFNSLVNNSPVEECITLMEHHMDSVLPTGVPTHILSFQTDWIFYDQLILRRAEAVSLVRSDHLPVVADFSLRPLRSPALR